ncbi:hypothetical protein Tco_1054045 [Tanacetum coccineum]|uniref:Uncharacterized protein n=1 Tax=Tanacetum coccineum TaxID=301880 RepID=A0ABQ5GY40_9ASTR
MTTNILYHPGKANVVVDALRFNQNVQRFENALFGEWHGNKTVATFYLWGTVNLFHGIVTGLPTTPEKTRSDLGVEIVRLHGTPTAIVFDIDRKFTSRFWTGLGELVLRKIFVNVGCLPTIIVGMLHQAHLFELLYGRKCRAPICWDEVGQRLIEGPELIEITNEKVAVAKEKLKEART